MGREMRQPLDRKCPLCGADAGLRWQRLKQYRYHESGLDNVMLNGGVWQADCENCGETLVHIEAEAQLLQVIALILLSKEGLLTGPETRFLRKAAGLSQSEMARVLGMNRQPTISAREQKAREVMNPAEDLGFRVLVLRRFLDRLKESGEDHLAPIHHKILEGIDKQLWRRVRQILEEDIQRASVEVQIKRKQSDWTSEELQKAA
jgi:transcriptional regulator with XRE-family HTH domain